MKRTFATLALAAALLGNTPGGLARAQTQSPPASPPPAPAQQTQAAPQTPSPAAPQQQPAENEGARTRQRSVGDSIFGAGPRRQQPESQTTTTSVTPAGSATRNSAARAAGEDEDEAVVRPVYQNYMAEYVLGPEDVVSIYVFGHPRYDRTGAVIPPDGRLYHYLIPEGVLVAGKTVLQVQQELTRRFDEFIIEPRVSVMLDRAVSARYSVVGDVTTPGVQTMNRRLTAFEAIMLAGGVTQTGDKSKVVVVRRGPNDTLTMIPVNIARIERGQAPDNVYLQPGDQVLVPGSSFRRGLQMITGLVPILSFARIFAGGW